MCMSFSRKRFLREREREGEGGERRRIKVYQSINFLYISIRIENVDSLELRNLKILKL